MSDTRNRTKPTVHYYQPKSTEMPLGSPAKHNRIVCDELSHSQSGIISSDGLSTLLNEILLGFVGALARIAQVVFAILSTIKASEFPSKHSSRRRPADAITPECFGKVRQIIEQPSGIITNNWICQHLKLRHQTDSRSFPIASWFLDGHLPPCLPLSHKSSAEYHRGALTMGD